MSVYTLEPTCPEDDTLLIVQASGVPMVHEFRVVMACPTCNREYVLQARLMLVEESARRTRAKLAQLERARDAKKVAA